MRKPDRTDRTDDQGTILQPLIPPALPGGRPREVEMREVLNTLLPQARTGCQWESLPHDPLPKSTVSDSFAPGRDDGTGQRITDALRRRVRVKGAKDPTPSVASLDRQAVQTTELGGTRGHDANKRVSGRKRHFVVDTLGLLRAGVVTAASADDGAAAPPALGQLDRGRFPRREVVYADQRYNNRGLDDWLARPKKPFHIEVVRRSEGSKGFVLLPKRGVSERSFAWMGRDRRQSKDYEYHTASSESWVRISAIGQMLRRQAPDEKRKSAPFMDKKKAAA